MTEHQAAAVLAATRGTTTAYVSVVKVGAYKKAATHAATETGDLACGTKPRRKATDPAPTSESAPPAEPGSPRSKAAHSGGYSRTRRWLGRVTECADRGPS